MLLDQLGPALDDLLTILEIESGALEPEWEQVDVAGLAGDGPEQVWVLGDRRLLQRALEIFRDAPSPASVNAVDGHAAITAEALPARPLDRYFVERVVVLHGGRVEETRAGLVLTLPAA